MIHEGDAQEYYVTSLRGNSKNYKGGEGFKPALLGGSILVNMSWLFFRRLSGLVHGSSSHERRMEKPYYTL